MATRSTKTGSAGVEFATAPQPWQIADLDADLDAIFANISNGNIQAGAGIATSKIAADAGITSGYLASNAVTTAKIANLAVTGAKIAVGGSVITTNTGNSIGSAILPSAETDVAVCGSITTRGGLVLILGSVSMTWLGVLGAAASGTLTVRLKRDTTVLVGLLYTLQVPTNGMIAIPTPQWTDQPAAGSYVYKLTAQLATAGTLVVDGTGGGILVRELA